ncbi:hypothetical protein HYY70_00910 [Candidatus Woesearchaeota archaeon]|nr:hypothetical protein [Candidatus Woesearchaeota archaeon]
MKIAAFAILFAILVAAGTLARGIEITEIDVHVDYDEAYTYRIENRDRIDFVSVPVANNTKISADILPGSNVTFTVRVENTFQGEEPDFKGVFLTITIEDIDDGADLEEESIDFDLEPGDDYRADVKFSIPTDVDSGTYTLVIDAEGEDKNETSFETKLVQKIEVKKQSHDIRIAKVLLNPSIVDCSRKAKLTAEIVNAGSNPESQIALEFKAPSLGINSYDTDLFLESSDEASDEEKMYTKTLSIEAPPFFQAGTYPIFINLYWKNFILFDQKTAELTIKDCASSVKKEVKKEKQAQEVINKTQAVKAIQPKEGQKSEKMQELITSTEEVSILKSPLLFSMLFGGVVIIILAMLATVGYLKSKAQ